MKELKLAPEEKELLRAMLEEIGPKTVTTIKELRMIDKICTLLESADVLQIEDTDFAFVQRRFSEFSGWVPKGRKEIITLADKLGI